MDSVFEIPSHQGELEQSIGNTSGRKSMAEKTSKKRGRPRGAVSASVTEVRREAAEQRRQLRQEYIGRVEGLQSELGEWKLRYDADIAQLQQELETLKRREACYQQILGERLEEVASRLQEVLLNWGAAELEEAQIDKRKRGRPRKTIK